MKQLEITQQMRAFSGNEHPIFICAVMGSDGMIYFQTGGPNVAVVGLNEYVTKYVKNRIGSVEMHQEGPAPTEPTKPDLKLIT